MGCSEATTLDGGRLVAHAAPTFQRQRLPSRETLIAMLEFPLSEHPPITPRDQLEAHDAVLDALARGVSAPSSRRPVPGANRSSSRCGAGTRPARPARADPGAPPRTTRTEYRRSAAPRSRCRRRDLLRQPALRPPRRCDRGRRHRDCLSPPERLGRVEPCC